MANDPMRILKADHREVRQLLTRLAETDEGSEREELAAEVQLKLTAHMDAEESIVYPIVEREVGAEDEEEAEVEHNLARDGLQKVMSMTTAPGFGAVVEMLKAGIEHHVEEEETQLLPELKESISREEWAEIGDQIAAAKEAAGLPLPTPPKRKSSKRPSKAKASKK
jgi:hemerythrin-like domain-containing protein